MIKRNGIEMYPTNIVRLRHLSKLCNELQNKMGHSLNILEVGSLLGDSAVVLSLFGHVTCVDLWDYEGGLEQFRINTKNKDIEVIQGSSSVILPKLKPEYDLIYLDGDHTYPVVLSDMTQAKRLATVVCGDDLEKLEGDFNLRFIDYIDGYHPGVSLAVKDVFGNVEMRDGFWWIIQ